MFCVINKKIFYDRNYCFVSYILSLWFLQEVTSGSALGHCSSIFAIKKIIPQQISPICGRQLWRHLKLLKLLDSRKVASIKTEIYIRLAIKSSQNIYPFFKISFLSWHPEYLFSESIKVFIWYESVAITPTTLFSLHLIGGLFFHKGLVKYILKILIYSNRHWWFCPPPPFLSCLIPKSWIHQLFCDSLLRRWCV